jgi:acetyltransferase-like isoleucine patch superfamily enzyme
MRAFIDRILQEKARRGLSQYSGVNIHPTAKVDFRKIRFSNESTLEIGQGTIVEAALVAEREAICIRIGCNTFIGSSVIACATHIDIGSDVLISWGCTIVDHNSHAIAFSQRKLDVKEWYYNRKDWTNVRMNPVKIGDKAWLGLNTVVMKGVEVGEGSIVAAGSVVTKSIPPWTIVAGNPATVIRQITFDER